MPLAVVPSAFAPFLCKVSPRTRLDAVHARAPAAIESQAKPETNQPNVPPCLRERMAPNPDKEGAGLEERQRVLVHACSLNRSDIIKKVVSTSTAVPAAAGAGAPRSASSSSGNGRDGDVDREVLDHVDEDGLTALHHAVKKSSLDVR